MKLSELIMAAQEKLEEFGDLDCFHLGWNKYEKIKEVVVNEEERKSFIEFK